MNSLKECLEEEKQKTLSSLGSIAKNIGSALERHHFKELLFLVTEFREVGIDSHKIPSVVDFLIKSNLFFMGESILSSTVTYGADPEFILCDPKDEDQIVLYSSKLGMPFNEGGEYAMSSLLIGADYGLLELRPEHSTSCMGLAERIEFLVSSFEKYNKQQKGPKIKETEAVPFMHKIQRMREIMDEREEIDYGGNRSKAGGVQVTTISDIAIAGSEYYGTSLTAYDNTPGFIVGTDKILTAGGHLHFGGSCIKLLSMPQLKSLIRKLDERLLPIAAKVETKAAELRREYYGFPGEFRLKPYGIEYRVLSCAPFWKKNIVVLKEILVEASRIITTFDFD